MRLTTEPRTATIPVIDHDFGLMSEEQLKAFLEQVEADTTLQEKLKAAATPQEAVVIAKEAGFSITTEALTKAKSELSEEELENVAGGIFVSSYMCHHHY